MILELNISDNMHMRLSERAKAYGISVQELLLGGAMLDVPNPATLAAMAELENGGGHKYESFSDFLAEIDNEKAEDAQA